ncbi:MAG: xanthine dehydrogenase family protein molybdopterin-binding subunit [Pseudomonadota bacterium]
MKFGIGQPVKRVEDLRLLRGEGRYVDDVSLPDQAHAALLRSPVAHGRVRNLSLEAARSLPGVLCAWGYEDISGHLAPLTSEIPVPIEIAPVSVPNLADETVRFVGQPVAFVVAETRALAESAVEAIEADFEELEAVTDPVAALAPGAPQLHPEAPGNLAYQWECGDAAAVEALFAEATHVVRSPVLNQRIVVASIEPRAINVAYDRDSRRWEAWTSSQGVFGMRAKLAASLGVDADRIRVQTADVGGAFGMKLMNHPEYALCALAAERLGRPVKWIGSRSEAFLSDAQGRDMRGEVEGAFDADGRCLAMRMRTVSGIGAQYSSASVAVHTHFSAPLLGGMYAVKATHSSVRGAFVNTPATDAYRGAGRPETLYATERLMEAAARQLGMDRAEIRRVNLVRSDQLPHPTPGGLKFDSGDTLRVLDRAIADSDYAGFEARAAEAARRGRHRGLGLTYYFERTGGGPVEHTEMALGEDGILRIRIGTQASGQGHETTWAQIAHEKLGLALENIRVLSGDSDGLPGGGGTGGSRSTVKAGQVLTLGAAHLVDQARAKAAEHLEAAEGDVEFDAAEARFRIAGTDRTVGLAEIAAEAGGITGRGHVNEAITTYPNGCHVCEVEIDAETGQLEILRYTVVDDFGTLINPMLVEGQVHGGVVQGIGQVIGEAAVWDRDTGQPVTGSFMDYQLPRAADVPSIALSFEELPAPSTELGVKGCGEAGSVGGIPSTALAVLDALWRAGVREPIETPYTPLKLWQALQRAESVPTAAE